MLRAEIRVKGRIDEHWSEWFDELTIAHTGQNETVLTGDVTDQSALYGLIAKLRDLGLPLISVNSVETDEAEGKEQVSPAESTPKPEIDSILLS